MPQTNTLAICWLCLYFLIHLSKTFEMEVDHPEYKIIIASMLGAVGGFLLAAYLYNAKDQKRPLSKHVAALARLIEQFEGDKESDLENLKERIESLLTTIEKSYGNPEE